MSGDYKRSHEAEQATVALTAKTIAATEFEEIHQSMDSEDIMLTKKQKLSMTFQPGQDTKTIQIHPSDTSKTAQIMANMDPK